MQASVWVEWAIAVPMIVGPLCVLHARLRRRAENDSSPRGLGARVAQVIGLFLLIPLIGILALQGKLSGETTGALLGVAIGYTLSGIEKRERTGADSARRGS